MNTKKNNQVDLEELDALTNRFLIEFSRYAHVSYLLPKSFVKQLEKIKNDIEKELINRDC